MIVDVLSEVWRGEVLGRVTLEEGLMSKMGGFTHLRGPSLSPLTEVSTSLLFALIRPL